jgi:dihydrofolate reductase
MTISIIVAVGKNNVIGVKNSLPWDLPADLAHFKKTTMSSPIIMGQTTFESIGRPLPGRLNIIMTKDKGFQTEGCKVVCSFEEAFKAAGGASEVFIIGGASIYAQALSLADKLYITEVQGSPEGDSFFRYKPKEWAVVSEEPHKADEQNAFDYNFKVLVRKR